MKKFLSILLALAVGFTFTFGSAMSAFAAAAPAKADQLADTKILSDIEKAYTDAKAELDASEADALKAIFGATKTKITFSSKAVVTKDAVKAVYDEKIYNAAEKELKNEYKAMVDTVNEGLTAKVAGFYTTEDANENGDISDADADGNKYMAVYVTFSAVPAVGEYEAIFTKAETTTGTGADAVTTTTMDGSEDGIKAVVEEQAKSDLEKKAGEIKEIKAEDYSTKIFDTKKGPKTHSNLAAELISLAVAEVENTITLGEDKDEAALAAYQTALAALYTPAKNNADATGKLVETGYAIEGYGTIALKNLLKVADEMTEAQKLEWAKNKALTDITNAIESEKTDWVTSLSNDIFNENMKKNPDSSKIKDWNEAIDTIKDQAAAAIDVVTYLINNEDDYTKLLTLASKFTDSTGKITLDTTPDGFGDYSFEFGDKTYNMYECKRIVALVAELKEEADVLKKTITIDGVTAADIDNELTEAIDDAYRKGYASLRFADAAMLLHERQDKLIDFYNNGAKVTIKEVKYDAVESWYDKIDSNTYDKKYVKDLWTIITETEAAIEAAETTDAADAAFLAGLEKFNAVPKKADRTKAQLDKEFSTLLAQYKKDIASYVEYKEASIANAKLTDKYDWDVDTLADKLVEELEASYTVDELKANFTAAKTFVDELKTSAALKEAEDALTKRVAELPKTAAVENRETANTLLKDIKDHNEYCDKIGNFTNKVYPTAAEKAVNDIKDLEAKAIQDQYKALYKDNKITVDEKDAVKALREAYDAFVEYYSDPEEYVFTVPTYVYVDDAEDDLRAALAKKFNDMVAVLPSDGADAAGMKAARDFYNSLDKHTQYDYIYQGKMYDKLADLEKLTVLDAKAYVQDLAIAARTTKVGKKVKVTAKADVQILIDNGYTVEYKFYKSTKKGSGYKSTVKKATNTYLNTNPVKGKKNYYKVKLIVKDAKGAVVATTPLTQCKFGVRTIK